MTFPLSCRSCGHVNQTKLSQVGQGITCEGCGVILKVPPPKEKAGGSSVAEGMVKFACPACGRKYSTKADMAGKKIRCSGCDAGVRVPGGAQVPGAEPSRPAVPIVAASQSAPPAARSRAPVEDLGLPKSLFDDEEDEESSDPYALAGGDGHYEAEVAEPALPSRAELLEKARQKAAEKQETEQAEERPKKKKKKKKKKGGYFNARDTWILVGSVGAFVVVLTGIAWAFPGVRFPLGGGLCVIGFIVYVIGLFQLRQLAAEEGFLVYILFRFFFPYQLWFVFTRWSEAKDFVAMFAGGLMILTLGGGVLATSHVGQLARESEAAYQRAGGADGAVVVPLADDDDQDQ